MTKLIAVGAAAVFVVLAVMLIRNVTGSPADEQAATERTDHAPAEATKQASTATTEPRVISPPRELPIQSPMQSATQSDADRTGSSSLASQTRTEHATSDPDVHDPSAQDTPAGADRPSMIAQPPVTQPAEAGGEVGGEVEGMIARGGDLWAAKNPIEARDVLNRALYHPRATGAQQQAARALMAEINDLLVFSPRVVPNDPMARTYEIKSGDILSRIARDESLRTDWRLLLRLNRISDPRRIGIGQKIKVLQGPFHADVYKSSYRIDFFADAKDSAGNRLYVCSRPCGLGEFDSTPTGAFKVRRDSKLVNPHWVNPRTGERFDADDPENPIGERWIGLEGTEDSTSTLLGYGIHGTIDSGSIGGQESMGCIRLLPADVELAYELLVVEYSTVEVLP